VESGWKACASCGTSLMIALKCPNCANDIEPQWRVCPNCETRLAGSS
jgi:predicted amidophosphoribosyltransferase